MTLSETKKAILIGHSNGGRIALAFTARYPGKLKQLILIDSAGICHNEFLLSLKRLVFKTVAKLGKKITSYLDIGKKDLNFLLETLRSKLKKIPVLK